MSSASIVAFAVLLVTAVAGQAQDCPTVVPMSNLESSRLSGDWIALRCLTSRTVSPDIRCTKISAQVDDAGVFNTTMRYINSATNEKLTKNAISTPIDGVRSKLQILINEASGQEKKEAIVLDTDYDNYVLSISCSPKDGIHGYDVTVISRQNELTPKSLEKIEKILKAANINGELKIVQQTNC